VIHVATSYNGWPASPSQSEIGVIKFGDAQGFPFPGGVKSGDVFAVLGYVATQLHERVEPCVGGWCWGYSYKQNVNNPSQLSCHASGTAIDWNAPSHPNGSGGTFSESQRGTIYSILDEVQGGVSWLEGYDEMHFEICVSASTLSRIAASLPAGGGGDQPEPKPEPEEEDDDMYHLYQTDGDITIYVAAPGVFEGTPSNEYVDALTSKGAAKPLVHVSQRELDILRDSYRRWPKLPVVQ
jgi:hypothetical protein